LAFHKKRLYLCGFEAKARRYSVHTKADPEYENECKNLSYFAHARGCPWKFSVAFLKSSLSFPYPHDIIVAQFSEIYVIAGSHHREGSKDTSAGKESTKFLNFSSLTFYNGIS
jgi:hypothetical protein